MRHFPLIMRSDYRPWRTSFLLLLVTIQPWNQPLPTLPIRPSGPPNVISHRTYPVKINIDISVCVCVEREIKPCSGHRPAEPCRSSKRRGRKGRALLPPYGNLCLRPWPKLPLLDLRGPAFDPVAFRPHRDRRLDRIHAFGAVQERAIDHPARIGPVGWLQG